MANARKPWWRRKGWIATAAIWLALPILYPLCMGPAFYAWYRDWISDDFIVVVYTPIAELQKHSPPFHAAMNSYVTWWFELYVRHQPEQFNLPQAYYLDSRPSRTD